MLDNIADAVVSLFGITDKDGSVLVGLLTILIVCVAAATSVICVLSWITGLSMWWGWLVISVIQATICARAYIGLRRK